GLAMTIEDSWGGDVVTAAIAHLAHSTPPEFLFTTTDFNSYVLVSTADGAPRRTSGRLAASTRPGLGITPRREVLGQAVVEVGGGRRPPPPPPPNIRRSSAPQPPAIIPPSPLQNPPHVIEPIIRIRPRPRLEATVAVVQRHLGVDPVGEVNPVRLVLRRRQQK